MMQETFDSDKRKILSAISHGSVFLSTFVLTAGIPLAIWLISDDPTVKESAEEALNFHLNIWLYTIIAGILTFVLIGWLILPIIWIGQVIMPILAIISSFRNPDNVFRYPFIFRVL